MSSVPGRLSAIDPLPTAIYHAVMARTTLRIDQAGRVVIPKDVRRRHLLHPGTEFELIEEGERLVLQPIAIEDAGLTEVDGLLVFTGHLTGPVPDHREVLEGRIRRLAGDVE